MAITGYCYFMRFSDICNYLSYFILVVGIIVIAWVLTKPSRKTS